MDKTGLRIIKRIGPLAIVLLAVSCINMEHWGPRVKREREIETSAAMPPGATLRAATKNGSISVQGSESGACHLIAKIRVQAANKENAEQFAQAMQVRLDPSADGLEVVTETPRSVGRAEYSVSLVLAVPRQSMLKLSSDDGGVQIKGIDGDVDATALHGDVAVEEVKGNIRLKSFDGDVTCSQIESGTVDVYNNEGSIRVSQAKVTSCRAETTNGIVHLSDIRADNINLRTTDGGIRCQDVAAKKLDCGSSDGSVYITWAPDAPTSPDITVALTDGHITFTGISTISAVLDAFSNSGPIKAQLPGVEKTRFEHSLQTTIGEGGGRLAFTTHQGSITIR